MKFSEPCENLFIIDFETHDATWIIVVIDDKWDVVKFFVVGSHNSIFQDQKVGLGDKCISIDTVSELLTSSFPYRDQDGVAALCKLPAAFYSLGGVRALLFVPFLTMEQEKQLLPNLANCLSQYPKQFAALMDRGDAAISGAGFVRDGDVVRFCDALLIPKYARAWFTVGGIQRDPCEDYKVILKESVSKWRGRQEIESISDWWFALTATINGSYFSDRTNQSVLHDADTFLQATLEDRKSLLDDMISKEGFGVWAWCRRTVTGDYPDTQKQQAWHAAKVFQNANVEESTKWPVSALCAACHGIAHLFGSYGKQIDVQTPLVEIPCTRVGLRNPFVLGGFLLLTGSYQSFLMALRDWLLHPEQFEEGKSHLKKIEVQLDEEECRLVFRYTARLPEKIFSPENSTKDHRVSATWKRLFRHVLRSSCENEDVTISLAFEPPT